MKCDAAKMRNLISENVPASKPVSKPAKQIPSPSRRTDKLSAYSKNERKLISKIFGIIITAMDEKTAETIIKKIEDELQ